MDINEAVENASGSFSQASGAVDQLTKLLVEASRAVSNNASASNAATLATNQLASREQAAAQAVSQLASGLTMAIGSFTNVTSSVYGADKAFTAVIPTVDAIGNTMKSVATAAGLAGSGFTAFGFSFGKASEAFAKGITVAIDLVTGLIKFQLETAQKVADSFLEVSKAGATFSGSIGEFGARAASIGIPMQDLTKIIIANAESISKLGSTQSQAGLLVAGMAKQIYNTNDGLVALYGNVNELASGVAGYLELQAQLGINIKNDYRVNKASAEEYLLRQRELTAITGKNAETIKREEQTRRTQLDYNLKLGRLGAEAQENVKEGLTVAGKLFGDAGAKYAEEYFATGGKIYSKEALTYQAVNQEAADAIANLVTNVNQSRDGFRNGYSTYLKANADSLEAFARQNEDYAEINRGANSPILKSMTETSSSILENLNLIKNSTDVIKKLEADRAEGPATDAATKGFVEAERLRSAQQVMIDGMVLENMSKMSEMVAMLYKSQTGIIQSQQETMDMFRQLTTGVGDAKEAIGKFVDTLVAKMGFQVPGQSPGNNPPQNNNPPVVTPPASLPTPPNDTPPAPPPRDTNPANQRQSPNTQQNRRPDLQPDPDPPMPDRRSQAPVITNQPQVDPVMVETAFNNIVDQLRDQKDLLREIKNGLA